MYFPAELLVSKKEAAQSAKDLLSLCKQNPKPLINIMLMNYMAILSCLFPQLPAEDINAFMNAVMYISGRSGSGKTSLATSLGRYTFKNNQRKISLISATGNKRDMSSLLTSFAGGTYLFDDVKQESDPHRRHRVEDMIDDIIRSFYLGEPTDTLYSTGEPITGCAIITGEFKDTMESQDARLICLDVGSFLQSKPNATLLAGFQKNLGETTKSCGGFIRWMLEKMDESSFFPAILERLDNLKEQQTYSGIDNAPRLNDCWRQMEMAAWMLNWYLMDDLGGSNTPEGKQDLEQLHSIVRKSIKGVMDDTFFILGGEKMAVEDAMRRIYQKARLRRPRYKRNTYPNNRFFYCQEHFWLYEYDDFIWIDNYKDSILKGKESNSDPEQKSYLLIRVERLEELFLREIQQMESEDQIPENLAMKLMENPMLELKKWQFVYQFHRSDGKWGRNGADYPCPWETDSGARPLNRRGKPYGTPTPNG